MNQRNLRPDTPRQRKKSGPDISMNGIWSSHQPPVGQVSNRTSSQAISNLPAANSIPGILVIVIPLLCLSLISGRAPAEDLDRIYLVGASENTTARLEEARKLFKQEKWDQGIDSILKLQSEVGEDLVYPSGQKSHCVSARMAGHALLTSLPKEGLERYRKKVEANVRPWLTQGKKNRDPELLRRIVSEAFCSRSAEEALHLLGDMAFERGDLARAAQWWQMLSPLNEPEKDATVLLYPDSTLSGGLLQAKQLLAQWLSGNISAAQWHRSLDAFRKKHREAKGQLAGQDGLYHEILENVSQKEPREKAPGSRPWLTHSGTNSRNHITVPLKPSQLSQIVHYGHHWKWPLPGRESRLPESRHIVSLSQKARRLAFHPVIADHQVFLCDAKTINAYDLQTGKKEQWHTEAEFLKGRALDVPFPPRKDLQCSLSVGRDCVIARMGAIALSDLAEGENRQRGKAPSSLVCLNRYPRGEKPRLRWRITPEDESPTVFQGSPVIDDHRAYVALTRLELGREITAIHCYPLEGNNPRPLWKRDICSVPAPEKPLTRQPLLSLSGSTLVYASHSGAIVALSTTHGSRLWSYRYLSQGDQEPVVPSWSAPNPCIIDHQCAYIAPQDAKLLLCFDLSSGRLHWKRDGIGVTHLLGSAQGNVLFTTSTPRPGIRAVNAYDGADEWYQSAPTAQGLTSWGRGLLAGDLIYWPTYRRLYCLTQSHGSLPQDASLLRGAPRGNMAATADAIAIADQDHLHVFLPPRSQLLQRRRDARESTSAEASYRQAIAELDAGNPGSAQSALAQAEALIQKTARHTELLPSIRSLAHKAGMAVAEEKHEAGQTEKAIALWEDLASPPYSAADQLEALQELIYHWKQSNPPEAIEALQKIRTDPTFQAELLLDSNALPQRASLWAARQLEVMLKKKITKAEAAALAMDPRPSLTEPLKEKWHRYLPVGDCFLLPDNRTVVRSVFSTNSRNQISCYTGATGERQWQQQAPFPIHWIGKAGDQVIAGGAQGLLALSHRTGHIEWLYPAPILYAEMPSPLSSFTLHGNQCFFLQQDRRVICLDVLNGEVLWLTSAPAELLQPPHKPVTFKGTLRPYETSILVSLTDRSQWLLDLKTGTVKEKLKPAGREIVKRSPKTGIIEWQADDPLKTTLTQAPTALDCNEAAIVIAPRNFGTTLHKWQQGKSVWQKPIFLPSPNVDPTCLSWTEKQMIVPQGNTIGAYSWSNGSKAWTRSLKGPKGRWKTLCHDNKVIAFPNATRGYHFSYRCPLGSVEWNVLLSNEEKIGLGWPVQIFHSDTGKPFQEIRLPSGPPRVMGAIAKGQIPEPRMAYTKKGIILIHRERAWHLESYHSND